MAPHRRARPFRAPTGTRSRERAGAPGRPLTDHFSPVAAEYAEFRPRYPAELFAWLAEQVPRHELAWDCAAGSGQASLDLAGRFARVAATDLSLAQLRQTPRHPRVCRLAASAEASALVTGSVDLVTVAQGLHWFDREQFYEEVRRVSGAHGFVAAWTYRLGRIDGGVIDAAVNRYYTDVVGACWPPERRHVDAAYATIAFPFAGPSPPAFEMSAEWTLDQLLGYVRTWSATARFAAANGRDPLEPLGDELRALWGGSGVTRHITWPLAVLAGRVHG